MKDKNVFDFNGMKFDVIGKDGEPWFVVSDVCRVLGIVNSRDAIRKIKKRYTDAGLGHMLNSDTKDNVGNKDVAFSDTLGDGVVSISEIEVETNSGLQKATIINETLLYELIFTSRKPDAVRFRSFVCSVVLPTIRKTGGYIDPNKAVVVESVLRESREADNRYQTRIKRLRNNNSRLRDENICLKEEVGDLEAEVRRSRKKLSEDAFKLRMCRIEEKLDELLEIRLEDL